MMHENCIRKTSSFFPSKAVHHSEEDSYDTWQDVSGVMNQFSSRVKAAFNIEKLVCLADRQNSDQVSATK